MNEPDSTRSATPDAESGSLRRELQSLRATLVATLVALLVVVTCLALYLCWQDRNTRRQLAETQDALAKYDSGVALAIASMMVQLTEYSKTHPDIQPILVKYPYKLNNAAAKGGASLSASVPGSTSAPVAVPVQKK